MSFIGTLKDKKFISWMLALSLPIAFQNLINAFINTADTLMVGQLGEATIASVGIANQVFFILMLVFFGITSGCNIFVAQFWGKQDLGNIRRSMALSIMLSLIPSFIFTILAFSIPQWLMGIFSNDPVVIGLGCQYLKIIAYSYIPCGISFTISGVIRTIERPRLALIISIISLATNVILNYILIFGKLGAPAMGVEGAALATVITRIIELVIYLILLYSRFEMIAARLADFRRALDAAFIKPFMRFITPVIINETTWGLGVGLYSVVFSRMGTGVVAAVTIIKVFDNLFNSFFHGMAYASGVMVGKTIGEHKEDLALEYGKKFNIITPVLNIALAVIIICAAPLLISFYNVSEQVRFEAVILLIIIGLFAPIRNTNLVQIVGVLRSGGDTKTSLVLDSLDVWIIALPMGFVFGLWLNWSILIVYPLMMLGEIVKFVIIVPRVNRGKWIRNLVRHL